MRQLNVNPICGLFDFNISIQEKLHYNQLLSLFLNRMKSNTYQQYPKSMEFGAEENTSNRDNFKVNRKTENMSYTPKNMVVYYKSTTTNLHCNNAIIDNNFLCQKIGSNRRCWNGKNSTLYRSLNGKKLQHVTKINPILLINNSSKRIFLDDISGMSYLCIDSKTVCSHIGS